MFDRVLNTRDDRAVALIRLLVGLVCLEEAHVFPVLIKQGGRNATIASVLKRQHDRGREITDYISALGKRAINSKMSSGVAVSNGRFCVRPGSCRTSRKDSCCRRFSARALSLPPQASGKWRWSIPVILRPPPWPHSREAIFPVARSRER